MDEEVVFDFLDFSTADQIKIGKDIDAIYQKAQRYDEVNDRYRKKIDGINEKIAEYEVKIYDIEDEIEDEAIEDDSIDDIDAYIAAELEKNGDYQRDKKILDRYKARLEKAKKQKEQELKKTGFKLDDIEKYHKKLLEARVKDKDALEKLLSFGEKYGYKAIYSTIDKLIDTAKGNGSNA